MKQGYNILQQIPEKLKEQLIEKYGSLDIFYNYLLAIENKLYNAYKNHNKVAISILEDKEYRIKEELERMGFDFFVAEDLVNEITGDFAEDIAAQYVNYVKSCLRAIGVDYNEEVKRLGLDVL